MLEAFMRTLGLNNDPVEHTQNNADPSTDILQNYENPFDILPNDMLLKILSSVPSPYLIGANAITNTSQRWHQMAQVQALKKKQTYAALLASCQDDPANALQVLLTDEIFYNLNLNQLIEVTAYCPAVAIAIINDLNLRNYTKFPNLLIAQLGSKRLEVTLHILNNKRLDCYLGELGAYSLEIAEAILVRASTDGALYQQLNGWHLVTLGSNHIEILQKILADNTLKQKLTKEHWLALAKNRPEFSSYIFADQSLIDNFSDLVMLGCFDLESAKNLLADASLKQQLTASDLCALGRAHLEIALKILTDDVLKQKLSLHDYASIATPHLEIARQIWADDFLRQQLDSALLSQLVGAHAEIAKELLADDILKRKLTLDQWVFVARHQPETAKWMITDPYFKQILTNDNLVSLGLYHGDIAQKMLADTSFKKRFSAEDLVNLAYYHYAAAKKILKEDLLKQKLTLQQWISLGKLHFGIARRMITDEYFKKILTAEHLILLGSLHHGLAQKILEDNNSPIHRLSYQDANHVRSLLQSSCEIEKCIRQHACAIQASLSLQTEEDELEHFFRTWRIS